VILLEELPRPEAAHIAISHGSPRVERERRPAVRVLGELPVGRVAERAGHAQVDDERPSAREPPEQVLAAPLERHDPLADERARDEAGVDRPGETRVDDLGPLDRGALEHGRQPAADRLDLGKLRHPAIVGRGRGQ
jgi:hypothetical protein